MIFRYGHGKAPMADWVKRLSKKEKHELVQRILARKGSALRHQDPAQDRQ